MKIEKISDNKIRIVLKEDDIKEKKINIEKLFSNTPESQNLFLEMLSKAKKEVNFETDGHKLLIETFFQEDTCVFTITRYLEPVNIIKSKKKKSVTVNKKHLKLNSSSSIYNFNDFEDFCHFCNFIYNKIDLKNLYKKAILYYYNNTYYLLIDEKNLSNKNINYLHSALVEFSNYFLYTSNFKFKLIEHGKIIIKNNALSIGMKYFAN